MRGCASIGSCACFHQHGAWSGACLACHCRRRGTFTAARRLLHAHDCFTVRRYCDARAVRVDRLARERQGASQWRLGSSAGDRGNSAGSAHEIFRNAVARNSRRVRVSSCRLLQTTGRNVSPVPFRLLDDGIVRHGMSPGSIVRSRCVGARGRP